MVSKILKEPLLGFFLAGGLVFILYSVTLDSTQNHVLITGDVYDELVSVRASLLGRPLLDHEKTQLLDDYVDNEILLREAVARNLHLSDTKVRNRLVEKMYFLFDQEIPEPTEEELNDFYETNRENYMSPPTVSFEHLFYKSAAEAGERLPSLIDGELPPSDKDGDIFWLGRDMDYYSIDQLISVLGGNFAKSIGTSPELQWYGPIHSARGWHLVRINSRNESQLLSRESIGAKLKSDWKTFNRQQHRAEFIGTMKRNYDIETPATAVGS